jgi:polar amino acid transport system substrate-binding protein
MKARALLRRLPQLLLALAVAALVAVGFSSVRPQSSPAGVLRISAGEVPPHMDWTGGGREAEIIRAALRDEHGPGGIEFHVAPFSRHWEVFKRDERLHAVATTPLNMQLKGFASQPYIRYRNGIIYRAGDFPDGLGPQPVAALRDRRVVAFAGAALVLPGLQAAIPTFRSYAEYDDQYVHSVMLARGFVDVVIADRLIVDAYSRQVLGPRYEAEAARLRFDPAFCPTAYRMVFRTDALRAAFDKGLVAAGGRGELAAIEARYDAAAGIPEVARPLTGCAP